MRAPSKGLSKFSNIEVSQLFQTALRAYKSSNLDILSLPKKNQFARVLPVISSKIANAPTRNLWKRRIRALFYELDLVNHTFDYLVIIKKPGLLLSFSSFKELFSHGMLVAHHNAIAHSFAQRMPTATSDTPE